MNNIAGALKKNYCLAFLSLFFAYWLYSLYALRQRLCKSVRPSVRKGISIVLLASFSGPKVLRSVPPIALFIPGELIDLLLFSFFKPNNLIS